MTSSNADVWHWPTPYDEDTFKTFEGKTAKEKEDNLIRGLTCYKWEDSSVEPVSKVTILKSTEIRAWLAEPVPTSDDKKLPVTGYKILQLNQHTWPAFPLAFDLYEDVRAAFKLPPVERHMPTKTQGASGMFQQDDGSHVMVRRRAHLNGMSSTVFRYDPVTNLSWGTVLTSYPPNVNHAESIAYFPHLATQFLRCPHPLLLTLAFQETELAFFMPKISEHHAKLKSLEARTGHQISGTREAEVKGKSNQELVRYLGRVHANYSLYQAGLFSLTSSTKTLRNSLVRLEERIPEERKLWLRKFADILEDRLGYFESTLEQTLSFGNMQTRLESQQSVLFNLIAQADTQVNISVAKASRELAAASKQDSSAMKIIAVLTTLFLPGTFVSSFFAMPLFDWKADSVNHITEKHFWLYWAVTAPLTIATVSFVIVWAVWRAKKTALLIQEASLQINSSTTETETEKKEKVESDSDESDDSASVSGDEIHSSWKLWRRIKGGVLARTRRASSESDSGREEEGEGIEGVERKRGLKAWGFWSKAGIRKRAERRDEEGGGGDNTD